MGVTTDLRSSSSSLGMAGASSVLRSLVRRFIEFPTREALEEITSLVFEDAWLYDEHAVDIGFYYFYKELEVLCFTFCVLGLILHFPDVSMMQSIVSYRTASDIARFHHIMRNTNFTSLFPCTVSYMPI